MQFVPAPRAHAGATEDENIKLVTDDTHLLVHLATRS